MTSSRFDYLRITLKPEGQSLCERDKLGKLPLEHCFDTLRITLLLDSLMSKMQDCGRCRHYEHRYSYENINLKVPAPWDYAEQGICLEMSGTGLDYFNEYLADYNLDLRVWLGMVRSLCSQGYIVNAPRLDYALDDICKNGEPTTISIRRIISSMENGEVCCRSRVWSDQGEDFKRLCSFASKHKRVRGEDVFGVTVQLGSRKSEKICRFYDKFAERKQKGLDVPENCTAWTRCEFEFHDGNAMCVLNHFIDDSADDFGRYICGVALGFVRFVERTSDNVTRCVTRRWWREFLNGATQKFKIVSGKPSRTAYARFSRTFRRQWLPSFNTLLSEWGVVRTFKWVKNAVSEESLNGREMIVDSLLNNLRDGVLQYDMFNAFERVVACSDFTPEQLREAMERNEEDYRRRCLKAGAYSGRV